MRSISFDPAKARKFRAAYIEAVDQHRSTFSFEGNAVVTGYARFVLELLSQRRLCKPLPKPDETECIEVAYRDASVEED